MDMYRSKSKRVESFVFLSTIKNAEKLGEAGFYYDKYKKSINCFECGVCIEDWKDSSIPTTEHVIRAVNDNIPCLFILRLLFQNLMDEMIRLSLYGRYYGIVFQALRWKLRKNRNCCIELNLTDIIDWLSVK